MFFTIGATFMTLILNVNAHYREVCVYTSDYGITDLYISTNHNGYGAKNIVDKKILINDVEYDFISTTPDGSFSKSGLTCHNTCNYVGVDKHWFHVSAELPVGEYMQEVINDEVFYQTNGCDNTNFTVNPVCSGDFFRGMPGCLSYERCQSTGFFSSDDETFCDQSNGAVLFNDNDQYCDWACNVDASTCTTDDQCNGGGGGSGVCTPDELEVDVGCLTYRRCGNNEYWEDPISCNQDNGATLFNIDIQGCDWADNVDVATCTTDDVIDDVQEPLCTTNDHRQTTGCVGYQKCNSDGIWSDDILCPALTSFNIDCECCDWTYNVDLSTCTTIVE